jgi:hypothetical protein
VLTAGEGKRCYVPSTLLSADPDWVEIQTSVRLIVRRSRISLGYSW